MKLYGGFPADVLIETLTRLMNQHPGIKRSPLSRLVCETLDWRGVDGRLSEMTCRVVMLRLQRDGLIMLPPSQIPNLRRRARYAPTPLTDPQREIVQPVHELPPLRIEIVRGQGASSKLWNEYMARYHYLGYTPLSGHQMRYQVYTGDTLVALLGFGASAWKLADRERLIGWSNEQRLRNLHKVINNTRFLILPWIKSKGLASKILAKVARQLPQDWLQRYHYEPVLLETFVESPRHAGTCYKAANWQCIGRTTGRGKMSKGHEPVLPTKDIWLYPLCKNYRHTLCC
jgi:hypothetical protein